MAIEIGTQVKATGKVIGTNPATQRPKNAEGLGRVIVTDAPIGFHGPVTIIRWANGVESYHCADDEPNYQSI